MYKVLTIVITFLIFTANANLNDVLGCGGFVKSHVQIDFSKVEIKLLTKQGILKDKTSCAPNNGYYFLPIYDKGEYIIQLNPPPGWSFNPNKVHLVIDGINDLCSKGVDINFSFKGFGITGRVESYGDPLNGPEGVTVELRSDVEIRKTETNKGGTFSFSPVYPGHYKIHLEHSRWKFLKQELQVRVTEGNTELKEGTLVIHGYSVSGYARSEGEAVVNTTVLLFNEKDAKTEDNLALGCDQSSIPNNWNQIKKPICAVRTDSLGRFTFVSVAVGKYYVTPFYHNQNIDVEPSKIEFTISNGDIELQTNFEVVGFSVSGRVLRFNDQNEGLSNVEVYVNNKYVTKTDTKGSYRLEKLKTGILKIEARADKMLFEGVAVKVSPNIQALPSIVPTAFRVCGRVDSSQSHVVTIVKTGSTFLKNANSDPDTGRFCEYFPKGTYEIQVLVKEVEKNMGLQFYPISQHIEVLKENDEIIVFSRLKATLSGMVQLHHKKDYGNFRVFLNSLKNFEENSLSIELKGQNYKFTDIYPGTYRLSLSANRFCWVKDTHDVIINSISVTAPTFIQNGYTVKFISSHNTKISYKLLEYAIKEDIEMKKGETTHCLPKDGSYTFQFLGCHTYSNNTFTFNTRSESNEIKLEAVSHENTICIASNIDHGPVSASIDIDGKKLLQGPLPYENGCYIINIQLEPEANAIILPQSETYYFKPPIFSVKGKNDCAQWGQVFKAIKGHVFKGKIIPPLAGALVTLEDENGDMSVTETDASGLYKFPPMDTSKNYKLSAKKGSYQLVGPLENGDFTAYKLAQVVVTVVDENKLPLQGTLLSLSGGLSYRSNLQTDEQGMITFDSLNPSEYYLRPMMKEYQFEPSSKIININEGETVNITLIGKRVAYSAFGIVTSLNKIPEENSVIEAVGVYNCSHFSEETTTESNGRFRVRGLQPYCTYHLRAKDSSVEQCIPEFIEIKEITRDLNDLHIIVLRPKKHTRVLVKINTDFPEYSKYLKLNVYLKGSLTTPIHTTKLDVGKVVSEYNPGLILYLPPLQKDGKIYILQLEPIGNQNVKWLSQSISFSADSTFKSLKMEFSIESSNTDQQIKQTSVWSLLLIILILFFAYNIDVIIQFANDKFNLKLSSLNPLLKLKIPVTNDYPTNEIDIDQIVQNINAVKKKPKRNS